MFWCFIWFYTAATRLNVCYKCSLFLLMLVWASKTKAFSDIFRFPSTISHLCFSASSPQKHELQAQQHFQQQLRRRREEEELHRQAELQAEARQDKADAHQHHHDKAGGKAGDKPKRPSSLLGTNNVMKLKQIIPLQGKFSCGASRSPAQSPTGGEAKLPGFLKFLKSPEGKKEPAVACGTAPTSTATPAVPAGGQERSQSPNRTFSPGKLFSFSKSEGTVVCANGTQQPTQVTNPQSSRGDLNTTPDELPSNDSDKGDPRQDLENAKTS